MGYSKEIRPADAVETDTVKHVYEVRPRKDHRGVDLISNVLPFGRLWYADRDAIGGGRGARKFERALSIHFHLRLSHERARSRDCSDIHLAGGFCLRSQPFSGCKGR